MRRTTIYLDEDLDLQLRLAAQRREQSVAHIIRDAVREHLAEQDSRGPRSPHAGGFSSGTEDTASRADEVLRDTGFGSDD